MVCPNCGGHIGRFELDQNCKHCGVNLFYSQQQKLLSEDAKRCELEYASFRIWVAKLKAAFIGSKLAVFRIAAAVLCVCALLIPFGSLSVSVPLFSHKLTFSAYGLYAAFSDGSLEALFHLKGISGGIETASLLLIIGLGLLLLLSLAMLLTEILSFTNLSRTAKVMKALSVLGMVLSLCSLAASVFWVCWKPAEFLENTFGPGAIVCLAAYLAMLLINRLYLKKGAKADIKQVDLDRVQLRKRVKAGEVSLDDLPLPVFESEEEKEKRLASEKLRLQMEEEAKSKVKGGAH